MPYFPVSSLEYGEIFKRLLVKRLSDADESYRVSGSCVLVNRDSAAAGAISDAILKDLKPLELARLVSLLPVSLRDKRLILPRAYELTKKRRFSARDAVLEYMRTGKRLIAEGFLRFRLPEVTEEWALAVDRAGEELLIKREYEELSRLAEETGEGRSEGGELTLVLRPDGSFAVTDAAGMRLESESTDIRSLLPILVSLEPELLTVYDLTGGAERSLLRSIRAVFGERACFFIAGD